MPRVSIATDDFNRGLENPLTATFWNQYGSAGALFSDATFGSCYADTGLTAAWQLQTHKAVLTANQYVQAKLKYMDSGCAVGLLSRFASPNTTTGYLLFIGFNLFQIHLFTSLTTSTLIKDLGAVPALDSIVSMENVGGIQIAYVDGVEVGRIADATYTSGLCGLAIYRNAGGQVNEPRWDDFECGNITVSTAASRLTQGIPLKSLVGGTLVT